MTNETRDLPATFGTRVLDAAQRWADKPAIVEEDSAVRYAALAAAARVIAGRVSGAAGGRSGVVCLLFQSKTAAIKALAGVSLSGSVYLMLDGGDPDARLSFVLGDASPSVILTERSLVARAAVLAPADCVVLDIDGMTADGATTVLPDVDPDAVANLVYTSASTGQPKGVMQTHRNLMFFADAYARMMALGEADRITLLYSLSFGAWNVDVFGGLARGATLYAYDVRKRGVAALADWLDREGISVLHAVPTVYRELMGRLAPGRVLRDLRAVALGGEAVFGSDVELFRRHTPPACIFVNQLAATEVSLIAQKRIDHEHLPQPDAVVPAGRCPPGVRVHVQREDGSEAAHGEIGEIIVSSPHLSPGYWRRPELDARAFTAEPGEPRWRRYATGDLGRIDENGDLCFLGRQGSRVKIRGFTVDLIEVERALASCPGVARCAVVPVVGDRAPEVERLVAHVTMAPAAAAEPRRLRQALAGHLPGYMLPAAFVFSDVLPLTASGKVDRSALAALEPPAMQTHAFEAPRDDIERAVATLFGELLKQTHVGRDDDFFLLGGDSLAFTELQLRLRANHRLVLTNVHDDVTVAAIAARIRALASVCAPTLMPVLVPLREEGRAPALFLVHGRLGQALVSPRFVDLLGDDQPAWAFQARGLDGLQAPHATVEEMAGDYLRALRQRQPNGPYALGALCAGAYVAIEMARLLRGAGATVLPLLLLDPPLRPFAMDDSKLTEDALLQRLRRRQAEGKVSAALDDPVYAKAAVAVARAFEMAIRRFRPRPYEGPAFVLSSRQRLAQIDASPFARLLSGPVECFQIAATHSQMLDVHNAAFARTLATCMDAIRAAVPVSVPPSAGTFRSPDDPGRGDPSPAPDRRRRA